jgi:hypothetical protein
MTASNYQSYKNLPQMAGICTVQEAMSPGLSVEEVVRRHKRYHYAFKRLHEITNARITAEPIYELKSIFSFHSHLCAEHTAALRERVAEMREPPLGLDVVPDTHLELFFDEILAAPTTEALVLGIYDKAIPALIRGMERHLVDTNPMVDHPSIRVCNFALLELRDMWTTGMKVIASLVDPAKAQANAEWLQLLDDALRAAGSLDGVDAPVVKQLTRMHSAKPFAYDKVPARDERFKDPYNAGVNAEAFLYDETMPPQAKVLMMFYKRLREIDVPEMMASIIYETKGKPWKYYRDMTRQLWDEARHAMMGEVGFASLGIDWPNRLAVNWVWSRNLNTQLTAIERHAVLFFIEQGLMPKTGKRYEWEVGVMSNNKLAALFQDFDWADEVLHARIGRDHYVPQFATPKEAISYGDQCWSRILTRWREHKEQGLTQHYNWWPDVYRDACKAWGIEPDPRVLAFDKTYETQRADLKEISVSG